MASHLFSGSGTARATVKQLSFSQQHDVRVIRDTTFRGPSFPHPTDVSINASTGQVTVRYTDKGHEKVETERLDLPPDLANGIILNIVKNIRPETVETKVCLVWRPRRSPGL